MFFIGIFGIDRKKKELAALNNIICPFCGHMTHLKAYKTFSYFHIFFIPTFRWNVQYWIETGCCSTLAELDPDIGRKIESGGRPVIDSSHLKPVNRGSSSGNCPSCGASLSGDFTYCPYCGKRVR